MANPPRPLEMKRKLGNPGRRPLPDPKTLHAIEPADDAPVPMVLGPSGRELWRDVVNAPWVSRLDLFAVQDLCQTWDRVVRFNQILEEDGEFLEEPRITPAGHVVGTKQVPHRALKALESAQKQLHSIASTLGYSPTARARLGLAEVRTRSKLEELAQSRLRSVNEATHPKGTP